MTSRVLRLREPASGRAAITGWLRTQPATGHVVYVGLYGDEDATPMDPAQFVPPNGLFLVGYLNGIPVASGGWRAHDGPAPLLQPGDAELRLSLGLAYLRAGNRKGAETELSVLKTTSPEQAQKLQRAMRIPAK